MRVLALCCFLIPLAGCISFESSDHGGGHDRGTSLSSAMQAAASGGGEPAPSRRSDDSHPHISPSLDVVPGLFMDSNPGLVSYGDRGYNWEVTMAAAYRVPLNGQLDSITLVTVTPLTFETERNYLSLYVGGGAVSFRSGSLPAIATRSPWWFETGLDYRHYFNNPQVFLSPYLSFTAGFAALSWDYSNPVFIDGEAIHSDSLFGGTLYGGVGVAVWRTKPVSLFGEAGFGGTIFSDQTTQGFSNDVFNNFGYFSVKAGLSIKF